MEEKKHEDEKLEAQKRFDALPDTLKREVQADKNVSLIQSICQDYSLPEEKVKYVTMLVGEVFLGYIKPEEVAHELTTYFDIDLQKANFIEIELKQKLFNSLKPDLDKIYNPIKVGGVETATEEVSPTMIKFEAEKPLDQTPHTPLNGAAKDWIPGQARNDRKEPLAMGNIPVQPTPHQSGLNEGQAPRQGSGQAKVEIPASQKNIQEQTPKEEAPFIIQTKVEAVKPAMPQFSKVAPSLNLKVDPSIIQKTPIIKPVSVRLETTEPVQEKKFQMPVIAGQKVFSSAPAEVVIPGGTRNPEKNTGFQNPSSTPQVRTMAGEQDKLKIEMKPNGLPMSQILSPSSDIGSPDILTKKPTEIQNPPQPSFKKEEVKIPVQQKVVSNQPQPIHSTGASTELSRTSAEQVPALSLKQISEQKIVPEPPKVVHYSTFRTELTPQGTHKKPESKNEDFINLNTFMRVSGNTIDLRKSN